MDVIDGPLFRTVQISAESRYGKLILGCYWTTGGNWYAQSFAPAYQWNNELLKVTAGPPYAHGWVAFPYPIAIIALAMIAAIPLVNWSRQFSLRTLLIAATLLAVVLGLAVWETR